MLGSIATMKPIRVLFLCTGNSCRSHMAEGLLRRLGGDRFEVCSAGSRPTGQVHPLAVVVMSELDIDLVGHRSKHLDEFRGQPFDYVITVCDHAREACPLFPGAARQLHWGFDDPADARGSEADQQRVFRRVRDEIRHRLRRFLEAQPR